MDLGKSAVLSIAAFVMLLTVTLPAKAVDWDRINGKDIMLFYPGQASWEWVLTQEDHSGAKMIREGRKCRACHSEQEEDIGNRIVLDSTLEPDPIPGRPGSIKVNVKTAHDAERLYVRLQWQSGKVSANPKRDHGFESKVAILLDDGKVTEAVRAGCWGSCHSDNTGMADAQAGKEITKYLGQSRKKVTRTGGGENYRSGPELDRLLKDGVFMEYWQANLNRDTGPQVIDGYVLDKRHTHATPLINGEAEFRDGVWTVTLSRKLVVTQPHYKDILPGKIYHLGIAIHEDYAGPRNHHVSFEHTLVLDKGKADFVAAK